MKKIQNAQFKRVYFACQRNITPLHVHTVLLFTCVTVFVHHDGVSYSSVTMDMYIMNRVSFIIM